MMLNNMMFIFLFIPFSFLSVFFDSSSVKDDSSSSELEHPIFSITTAKNVSDQIQDLVLL